jgi:phosphatidylserine/phosphatidylglycerophosphate/cardiolipin synthase-like enzyme
MAQIVDARAWCNNEVAYLSWKTDGKIADCLGFMITRVHLDGQGIETERRILPAWAAFNTQSNPDWEEQDTSVWPIQKFSWRDLTLRRLRDKAEVRDPDFQVKYEIRALGKAAPGRPPVPKSPNADPKKYRGDPIPLFFCTETQSTNVVSVTNDVVVEGGKPIITAGFTNGILSTQNLRKQLKTPKGKAPTKGQLQAHIDTDKPDKIRTFLTADALPLIAGFMARAKTEDCDLYLALYELNDPVLIKHIEENADRAHVILSTAGATKPAKGSGNPVAWDGTNKDSRALLRDKVLEFHDRMFNNSAHIGHNKFGVMVDRATKKAKAVLAGSTNWTFTGLCTQTNNVIVINDPNVAAAYFGYWKRLRDDKLPKPEEISEESLSEPNSNKQGQTLRTANMEPSKATLTGGGKTEVELWYSPNTKAATKNPNSPVPPDLKVVFDLMDKANDAIFFLTFMPSVAGDKSVIIQSLDAALKKNLLVLGAISDGRALPNEDGGSSAGAGTKKIAKKSKLASKRDSGSKKKTAKKKSKKKSKKKTAKKRGQAKRKTIAMAMRHEVIRSARKAQSTKKSKKSGGAKSSKAAKASKTKTGRQGDGPQPKRAIYTNPKAPKVLMIRAAAIGAFDLIGDWEQEMLKYGQAIIHDKIVVIDPLSKDDCVVITGSHNLGYKASYANDENLLIIKGNRALAIAYMVHILDVQDHYKFRAILEQQAFERATGKAGTKPPVGKGILNVDDTWQDKYLSGKPNPEQTYFLGPTEA